MAILPQIKPWQAGHGLARLLAQDCLLCAEQSGDALLCAKCAADLPRLPAPACPRCIRPTAHGELCASCLITPPHYDATYAAYRYAFPLDKLIHAFKYGHRLALGAYFGQQLAELARAIPADLLIPLPLHPHRLRQRGFNQAQELARPVGAHGRLPLATDCCQRLRDTAIQAGLPLSARAKNLRGAFHCNRDLGDRHILLVDDVMTSGATLDECARTLKLHGARRVTLLVLARALPERD